MLDGVDGWVARRNHTSSLLGARFDMEVDAFLILVLSAYVARSAGVWVLAIGVARYALLGAGWLLPWLRRSAPSRFWGKVVAAVEGIVLTFAAADILPIAVVEVTLAVSSVMLAESFGREMSWLWRHRHGAPSEIMGSTRQPGRSIGRSACSAGAGPKWLKPPTPRVPRSCGGHRSGPGSGRRTTRKTTRPAVHDGDSWPVRVRTSAITVLAVVLVWFALVGPDQLNRLTPIAFVRIPLEGLLLAAVVLVLPPRPRQIVATLVGVFLGLLTILKLLDMGFFAALDRPFHPVIDWSYFDSAEGLLGDSVGRRTAIWPSLPP